MRWLHGRRFMIFVVVFQRHQLGDKLVMKERVLLGKEPV